MNADIPAALLLHEQPPAEVPADYLAFGRAVADYLRRAHGDHTPLVEIATRYGVAREVRTARTVVIVIPPPP